MTASLRSLGLAAMLAVAALPAIADNGLVTRPSKHSVATTIDRLEAAVKAAQGNYQIFARVDFQAVAANAGGTVRPHQLLLFGRGGALQPLLPGSPTSAIDLPLKLLAWEDEHGKTWVAYNTGEYLRDRHAIQGNAEMIRRLSEVTEKFARLAADE